MVGGMVGGMNRMEKLNFRYNEFAIPSLSAVVIPTPINEDEIKKALEPLELLDSELTRIMRTCNYNKELSVLLALTYKLFGVVEGEQWPGVPMTYGTPNTTLENLQTVETLLSNTNGDIRRAIDLYDQQKQILEMWGKSKGTSSTATQERNPGRITEGMDPMGPSQLVLRPPWAIEGTGILTEEGLAGVDTTLIPPLCMDPPCRGN